MDADEIPRTLPSGLWARLRADPVRAPEHLALAAAEVHGPAARDWVAERTSRYAQTPRDLALMAKKRHASLARLGGAAGGVGGFITLVPDLAAAVWIQSRVIYFIAAAYGFDPLDRMRPAEQLVLQGLYATPSEARAALDGAGKHIAIALGESRLRTQETLARRLTSMLGRHGARRVAGRFIPFVGVPLNAIGHERETRELADRAIKFYGG